MIGVLEVIRIILLGIFLVMEGVRDLIKRRISMVSVIIAGSVGGILRIPMLKDDWASMLGGILIGIIIMLLAKCTKEKIGYGDGWVLVVTGIYLGFRANMYLLFLSLFFSCFISIILLVCKKAVRQTELPFVTFMVPGYLLLLTIQ